MRSLFRITCYAGSQPVHSYVLAGTVGEAARHLGVGVDQFVSGTELARDVETVGVDKPHAKLDPTPVSVLPPYVPQFSPAEVEHLESLLSPAEISQLRGKLTPDELEHLRLRRLTESEAQELKIELQTREPHGQAYRHA